MSKKALRRISRKEQKIVRERSHKLLCNVQSKLRKDGYRFNWIIVGSGSLGTMIEDSDGTYDLDYQILLSKRSKCIKDKYLPKRIKDDFFDAFSKSKNKDEKMENSTTAITLKNDCSNGKRFSVDFVIINEATNEIIRRNGENQYTWNMLPSRFKGAYRYFKQLNHNEKKIIIETVVERKCEEKRKPNGKSSSEIMIEEINNYAYKKGDNL